MRPHEPSERDVLRDLDDRIADATPPAARRVSAYKPRHRQVEKPSLVGPSPWEKPREGFTAAMTERVPEMNSTRQSRMVRERVNW